MKRLITLPKNLFQNQHNPHMRNQQKNPHRNPLKNHPKSKIKVKKKHH